MITQLSIFLRSVCPVLNALQPAALGPLNSPHSARICLSKSLSFIPPDPWSKTFFSYRTVNSSFDFAVLETVM